MKIKFIEVPKGRPYKKDEIVEFKGAVDESYARKYIARGWAVEVDEAAERAERQRSVAEDVLRKKLQDRSAVVIPEKYADLPPNDLRVLASKLTDEKIGGKDDALAAIAAEIARRAS